MKSLLLLQSLFILVLGWWLYIGSIATLPFTKVHQELDTHKDELLAWDMRELKSCYAKLNSQPQYCIDCRSGISPCPGSPAHKGPWYGTIDENGVYHCWKPKLDPKRASVEEK